MLRRITIAVALSLAAGATAQIPALEDANAFSENFRLPPGEIARLEAHLVRNPGDLSVRARLLTHYFQFAAGQPRLEHILWVVKNHPESKLAGSPVVRIYREADTWTTRSDYEAVRALWLINVEGRPNDAAVLGNAGRFFEAEEPVRAAELLRRSWKLDPANKFRRSDLIGFYARVVKACESPTRNCPDPVWLIEARTQLEALSSQR
jgi:hypothetical protein